MTMEKKFIKRRTGLPFDCPFCGMAVNITGDIICCRHVQFVHVTMEAYDRLVYVKESFAEKYLARLESSGLYDATIAAQNDRDPMHELEENLFLAGDFGAKIDIASQIPYFEDIAVDVCSPDSVLLGEERPYMAAFFCVEPDAV
jgi:hypothetical protein